MNEVGVMLTLIIGGLDPHTLLDGKKANFVHSQAVGMQKTFKPSRASVNTCAYYELLGETFQCLIFPKLYPHLHMQKYSEPMSHHISKVSPI